MESISKKKRLMIRKGKEKIAKTVDILRIMVYNKMCFIAEFC